MPWRGHNGKWCRGCGRDIEECGPLSARYRCVECGETNMLENHRQLIAHDGPAFEHWRRRTLAAFGVIQVDADRGEV